MLTIRGRRVKLRSTSIRRGRTRFMVNRFRELLPYLELPIRLMIRERQCDQKPEA